jgi:hypothetical protein
VHALHGLSRTLYTSAWLRNPNIRYASDLLLVELLNLNTRLTLRWLTAHPPCVSISHRQHASTGQQVCTNCYATAVLLLIRKPASP